MHSSSVTHSIGVGLTLVNLYMLYDLIFIPMGVFELPRNGLFSFFDIGGAAFWTLDIGASFSTGTFIDGNLIRDPWLVACKYAKTWLPFDIVMVLADWIALVLGEIWGSTLSLSRSVRSGRVLRYVRLSRFFRLLRIFKAHKIILSTFESKVTRPNTHLVLSISKLLLIALFLIHILACVWYALGIEGSRGWVVLAGIEGKSLGERYAESFQHATGRLHPSRMHANAELKETRERLLAAFATAVAVVGSSLFVSSITTTMGELKKLRSRKAHCSLVVHEYLSRHKISLDIARRARKFCDTESVHHLNNRLDADLLEFLPPDLMAQLRVEAWSPTLAEHPLFRLIHANHPRTENQLCYKALSEVHVYNGVAIFTTGDSCGRMLFTVEGQSVYKLGHRHNKMMEGKPTIHSIMTASTNHTKVEPGTWLCEPALFTQWQYCGDLRATTDVALIALCAEEIASVAMRQEQAYFDIVIYAKCFLEEINANPQQINDLPVLVSECLASNVPQDTHGLDPAEIR